MKYVNGIYYTGNFDKKKNADLLVQKKLNAFFDEVESNKNCNSKNGSKLEKQIN